MAIGANRRVLISEREIVFSTALTASSSKSSLCFAAASNALLFPWWPQSAALKMCFGIGASAHTFEWTIKEGGRGIQVWVRRPPYLTGKHRRGREKRGAVKNIAI